jgi:hypothetical protein
MAVGMKANGGITSHGGKENSSTINMSNIRGPSLEIAVRDMEDTSISEWSI